MTQVLITLSTIIGGYLLLYVVEFLWNMIVRAPVALDSERAAQIAELGLAQHDEVARAAALLSENVELKKPQKSPAEKIRFEEARAKLEEFDPPERRFLSLLLPRQEVPHHELKAQFLSLGFTEAQWSTATLKAYRESLVDRLPPSATRAYNAFGVNPIYRDALLELLHSAK